MVGVLRTPAERKIGDIQVLRGFAVATVIFQHLHLSSWLARQPTHAITPSSWLAVDLFFVLSGFVITASLFRDRFEPVAFLVKRAFRLMPAALIFIGLAVALNTYFLNREMEGMGRWMYVVDPALMKKMSYSILLGYFTLQPHRCAIYGGMWSLSIEDQFYVGLALVCLIGALAAGRRASRLLPAMVFILAASVYLACLALRLQLLTSSLDTSRLTRLESYVLFHRMDLLPLGVLLAYANRRYGQAIANFFEERGPFLTPFLLLGPFALTALTGPIANPQTLSLAIPVSGICFGLLTLAAAHDRALPARRGAFYRFGCFLGDRSYSIYLYHFLALPLSWIVVEHFVPNHAGPDATIPVVVMQLFLVPIFTLPLVEVVYRRVEQPLTDVGRRLAKRVRILRSEPSEPSPTLRLQEAA